MSLLLLGHRGARASRLIPENTLASFELCLQQGCDGFEFDVRLSADGRAVICHDAVFHGISIANAPANSLALPKLEDVLRRFERRAFLDIELKVAGLEELVLDGLRKHRLQKGYVVSSFLSDVIMAMHALDAKVPLGLLCETKQQLQGWPDSPAAWVIPRSDLANRELVTAVHAAQKKVAVWTVNRADRMREFAEWGIDAIISDETELLVKSLRRL